jgi:hypothetical protein
MSNRIGWKPKSSDRTIASVRYRCLIPLEALRKKNFNVELFCEKDSDQYDAVIFSKLYDIKNQELASKLNRNNAKVILDICDNHFYNPYGLDLYENAKDNLLRMLKLADEVICSADALADVIIREAGLSKRPKVIGDPIETLPPPERNGMASNCLENTFWEKESNSHLPRLLWFGSHGSPNAPCGMTDLLNITETLKRVYTNYPFELVVSSNNEDKFNEFIKPLPFPTRYFEWKYNHFRSLLESARGVIIPISLNPFTQCKTNNRVVMALNHGVPVVANSIPSYEEFRPFCHLDDWEGGLKVILGHPRAARQQAEQGRQYIQKHWMAEHIAEQWESILKNTLLNSASMAPRVGKD